MTEQKRRVGRPKGKKGNTLAVVQAAAARAVSGGKLPHELLLDWARGEPMVVKKGAAFEFVELNAQQRLAAAIAAGPYYAPRLISHEVSGKGGGAIPMSVTGQVSFYIPENSRRVAPPAPANDEQQIAAHRGNGEAKAA